MIRRSPIHAIKELENLVGLLRTNIQHRRDALNIAEILEDVFVNTYLPENRRLVSISVPLTNKQSAVLAFVEQSIKNLYSNFLDLLQVRGDISNPKGCLCWFLSSKLHMIPLRPFVAKPSRCFNVC